MSAFQNLLDSIKNDCAWETIPEGKITALAKLCGPAEIRRLIAVLDSLDDADLVDDAGDMGDEYWRLRTSISMALAGIGEPAVEPLLGALGSGNPQTRGYAARALGLIGSPRAFEPLMNLVRTETDELARWSAISAVGRLRDPRALPALLPLLNAPEQQNRQHLIRSVAQALGRIADDSVFQPLAALLKSDPNWYIRLGAAEGLVLSRDRRAIGPLRLALQDEDPNVRKEAAAGLTELGAA